ncbi:hypothetical protein Ancab_015591 [Ancistrocladus abbreviatus]
MVTTPLLGRELDAAKRDLGRILRPEMSPETLLATKGERKLVETDALRDEPQEEFMEQVEFVGRDLVGVANMRVLIRKEWEAIEATSIDVLADNEAGIVTSATAVIEEKSLESHCTDSDPKLEENQVLGTKEQPPPAPAAAVEAEVEQVVEKFQDPRWVNGTWDLK